MQAGSSRVWLLALVLASGCASLDGPEYGTYDPWEGANRTSYGASEWVDRNALRPVARGYETVTPRWLRGAIGNFFDNLREVDSALNGFLQGKPQAGATDLARVVLNSTVGLAGLRDVASRAGLRQQEEDLGQTLTVYGMTRSRYVYVPLAGPTTVRDAPTMAVRAVIPRLVLGGAYRWWVGALDILQTRVDFLAETDARDASALDPYAFTRDAYYQRRRFLVYDGDPPIDDFFDEFDDE